MHVLDASRSVGVVNSLLNPEQKKAFAEKTREEYQRLREEHAGRGREKKMRTLEEAREKVHCPSTGRKRASTGPRSSAAA